MRYLVTAEEMRRYDNNTIETIGIPGMVLMERAALAAAEFITGKFSPDCGRVLVMAGVGNNGGDGLAVARILSESGFDVDVWRVGDETKASEQWSRQRHILQYSTVRICDNVAAVEYTILVDALFGVGLSREVTGLYAEAIRTFNSMAGFKLALDVPSGVDSDTGCVLGCAVKADATMGFGLCKRGILMYPGYSYAGEIFLADIGIRENSFLGKKPEMFCFDSVSEGVLERDPAGNKGTFGKVLLVAGNTKMAGAAILAAKAAYRSGAGMVKVISHEDNREIIQKSVPEALFGTEKDLDAGVQWADVVAVGPGLGTDEWAKNGLEKLILECQKPLLADADGLNLLAANDALSECLAGQERTVVLTPHVGELSRLLQTPAEELKLKLWEYGRKAAGRFGAVVVAKDARTYICAKDMPICMNVMGNCGMATAGSGDVLTGILTGYLAQIYGAKREVGAEQVYEAVCQGVLLHAAAGDLAAEKNGQQGIMAGDIAEAAAEVLRDA